MSRSRIPLLALFLLPAMAAAQAVTAESAVVMDNATGKVLWARTADEELYPASTTKIMPAMLLLEHCTPDEIIQAPMDVEKVKESSMHLKPGENVRAKDMLYAMMLRSANDACYAVAMHISGSVDKFADLMNARAKEIGCTHTHFDNPNGLNDKLHYTTAHDLALIGRQAMSYEPFRDIVRTEKTKINRGTNWRDLWMVNHNKILKRDPTCDGIKTGWTIPAGHCFVGSASRDGWRVITVVRKSKSWENDTENLFNWAYSTFAKQSDVVAGQALDNAPVEGGVVPAVQAVAAADVFSLTTKDSPHVQVTRQEMLDPKLVAPVTKNEKIGSMVVRDADGFEQKVDMVAAADVPAVAPVAKKQGGSAAKLWMGAGLLGGVIYMRGRSRKRARRVSLRPYRPSGFR